MASDLSRLAGQVRFDPERLTQIEERLYLLSRLTRKHGGTLATVLERHQTLSRELEELGTVEEGLQSRRAAVEQARTQMAAVADALSERRRKAARTLGRRIDETLRELGLREAAVKVVVEDRGRAGRAWARPRAISRSLPTRERRPARWPASRPAASCRGSCSRSSGRWPSPIAP